ncbi:MAG TPA: BatD family protein, partial [Verrucomicrobiae bacterium]|nr:BatD family protein [Verrucomicrobiae bacterium]
EQASSQSYEFSGGQPTAVNTTVFKYGVSAQHEGVFTIPGMQASLNGQLLASQPVTLTVQKPNASLNGAGISGNEIAVLRLSSPPVKYYAGESAALHFDLYLRDDIRNLHDVSVAISSGDAFSTGKAAASNSSRRLQVGNRAYTIVPVSVPLTAVKTGTSTLGPFTATIIVDVANNWFLEQRQFTATSDSTNVSTAPLPSENKPANFSGAVGNFTLAATAGPATVTVGDPITVHVKISGHGSFDSVTLPAQDSWHDFKAYPPTSKLETSDQIGLQGTKTFEQIISPLNTDIHALPPLDFSFFNPEDGKYHSLQSTATPLTIKAAGATPMPVIAATKTSPAESQSPQDILPAKDQLGTLVPSAPPLIARPGFLAAQAVPVLAFVAAFVWRRRTDSLANNPRLRRRLAVAQLMSAGIMDLKKYAAANQPDEFFATLFRLLQEQLGERLDCPATAITENVIEEHPVLRTAPKATLDGLRDLFQLCNQARYAPVRGTSELNSVAAQFEKAIGQLQEVKA